MGPGQGGGCRLAPQPLMHAPPWKGQAAEAGGLGSEPAKLLPILWLLWKVTVWALGLVMLEPQDAEANS